MRFERASTPVIAAAGLLGATAVQAHHGFGQFDRSQPVDLDGTITGIDFVNPHSYLRLDVTGANGETIAMRCEMRAATLMRRSGWSEEMFATGSAVSIQGWGHRTDPAACYIEDIKIGDAEAINRNDQFSTGTGAESSFCAAASTAAANSFHSASGLRERSSHTRRNASESAVCTACTHTPDTAGVNQRGVRMICPTSGNQ